MIRVRMLAVGLLALVSGSTGWAQPRADGQQVIRDILAKWEERRNAFDSIAFKTSGTILYPKGCFTGTEHPGTKSKQKGSPAVRPPEDYRAPTSVEMLFDLAKVRIRKDMDREEWFDLRDGGRFAKKVRRTVYDGKDVKSYEPRKANNTPENPLSAKQYEVWIQPKDSPLLYDASDDPLFCAVGFVRSLFRGTPDYSTFRVRYEVSDFAYRGSTVIDGHECHQIDARPRDGSAGNATFWVDRNRGGLIVRCVAEGGNLVMKLDTTFQEHGEHWLPQTWTLDWSNREEGSSVLRLYRSETRTVQDIQLNPEVKDNMFDIELTPNMIVWKTADMTAPGKGHYYVGRDGETLVPIGLPDPSSRWPVWLKIGLGCALVLTIFALIRYGRRKQTLSAT